MKHKLATLIWVPLLGTAILAVALAQQSAKDAPGQKSRAKSDPAAAEIAAIRAQSEAFVAAFNKGDAKAIAAFWTENGEYVDETGKQLVGRDAIEKGYAEFFSGSPNAKIQITIDSVRLLSDDAAIEDGRAIAEPPPAGAPGVSKYTATHVKVKGKWLMASVRDSWMEAPATSWSAADLEWLVGTWVAEEHGVRMESVCRWVADGRFLERAYTTTQVDGTASSGVQLIGWDPLGGHVQSWSFSPDGGHATGIWLPHPGGWMAHMRGTTGDGAPTTSINRLSRLDDNAYVSKSSHRTIGSSALRDTDEIVWKRQPAGR